MKKLLYLVLSICVLLSPVGVLAKKTADKEPVKVYIFYGETCGYCAALHEYTDELQKDKKLKKKFDIVDYEVWKNEENSQLMVKVADYFDYEVTGVPFYVVGDQYFSGFDESSKETLVDAINEEYNDKNYKDIVGGIVSGSIEVEDKEASEKTNSDAVAYVILGVTVVVVLAILFGRSKNKEDYDEEVDDTLEDEETKEPKKEKKNTSEAKTTKTTKATPKKKTTTKKTTTKKTTPKKTK